MEEMEKIYCADRGCSAAEVAALMNNGNNDALTAMLANGNNINNSPWMYLIFLALFGGNGFGWNRNGEQSNFNTRLSELSNQISDNHNNDIALQAINGNREALGQLAQTFNCDINSLQNAVCGVKSAIESVGGQVGYSAESVKNAIALGDSNIITKMQECCCANKLLVTQMGYEGQLRDQANTASIMGRIDQLANGVQQGFSQVGYAAQANTQAIINAQNANTQRILDQMCTNTTQELRDKLAECSQREQTANIIAALKSNGCCCN